jgi:hypothetical protein
MPTLKCPPDSPLHRRLVRKLSSRIQLAKKGHQKRHEEWREAEDRCLAFVHESEKDAARRNARDKGSPRYTTIMVPYTYAMLMSAHTYWTSVFFARSPIHQYAGRHGEGEMQVQAMEALIGYQTQVGGAMGPYYIWLYDIGKYGCGILGHYWCYEKLHYGQLVEMTDPLTNQPGIFQMTQEIEGYRGNKSYNCSPWDFMHDPRVSLKNFQQGEFCCRRVRQGWNELLRRKEQGYYNENIDRLKTVTDRGRGEQSSNLELPQFDHILLDGDGAEATKHAAGGAFWEVYVELIPSEWGLQGPNFPQKWCFTITEDETLVIGAQPMGLVHCKFPFDVGECEVEGYGTYTRGMPKIMEGIQNTVDWLINTHFFNVRQALNNQFIVDPSKLVVKDVQNSGPGFIWRLRPEAYGTDITKMFMQVQVNDVTRSHISDFQTMLGIGERTLGVNDQIMGSLNTGSARKTATEVRTTTGFGVNRMKTNTEYISVSAFEPHSQKLVQNSQQFYDAPQKLRRVGSFAQEAGGNFMMVAPEDIAGFFDLVPVDGTMPIDRMAQANLWKEIMAGIRMMPPQIAMGYDWMRIFGWTAQLAGLRNINQFRLQVMPDQMLGQQAQQGNVIPMPQRPGLPKPSNSPVSPGNSASTQAGLDSLTQEGSAYG